MCKLPFSSSYVVTVGASDGGWSISLGPRQSKLPGDLCLTWRVSNNLCCFKPLRFWSYYQVTILTCTKEPVEVAEICFPTSESFSPEGSDPVQDFF